MRSNFDKNEVSNADYQGTPYDYLSIMHYGKTTFRMYGVNGNTMEGLFDPNQQLGGCLLYTSPSPRDATLSRMPSSA